MEEDTRDYFESFEKVKKYDRILEKKLNKEKKVKFERLLFQKKIINELNSFKCGSEEILAMNEKNFLALLPPCKHLEEKLHHLEEDSFVPIFPTEPSTDACFTDNCEEPMEGTSSHPENSEFISVTCNASTVNFIKRNVELARNSRNIVSMTDGEKARLDELLSDIDELGSDDSDTEVVSLDPIVSGGFGFVPDSDDIRRLQEIDMKISALCSHEDITVACGCQRSSVVTEDENIAICTK